MTLDASSKWHVVLDGLPVKDYIDFEDVSLVKMGHNQIHVFVRHRINPMAELMKFLEKDFWLEHYGAEKLVLTRKEYNTQFLFKVSGNTAKLSSYCLTKEEIGVTQLNVGISVNHWSLDLAADLLELHHGLKVTHDLKPYERVPFKPELIMQMYVVEDVVYPMLVSVQVEHDRINLLKYYRSLFFNHWPMNVFLTLEEAQDYLKKPNNDFAEPKFHTLNGKHFHAPIQTMSELTMSLDESDKKWSVLTQKLNSSANDMDSTTAKLIVRMTEDEQFKNDMFTTLKALEMLDEDMLNELKRLT